MFGGMRHMAEPRLRTVNKAVAPFAVNKFPSSFVETCSELMPSVLVIKFFFVDFYPFRLPSFLIFWGQFFRNYLIP